jgi:hypothetical protein
MNRGGSLWRYHPFGGHDWGTDLGRDTRHCRCDIQSLRKFGERDHKPAWFTGEYVADSGGPARAQWTS